MRDGAVESIVARCLVDPGFLASLRRGDDVLAPYGLDDDERAALRTADFERIRNFSGFIGKVQHNHLWESFPGTRRLLEDHGVEIDVFAGFREEQLRLRRTSDRAARTLAFVDFLERLVAISPESGDGIPGLSDVLRHERFCWEIARERGQHGRGERRPSAPPAALPWPELRRRIPVALGGHRVGVFRRDPCVATERARAGQALQAPAAPFVLLYRADPHRGSLQILEIDPTSASVLEQVNGLRSVRTVIERARRSGRLGVPPSGFREFFEAAASEGLLELRKRAPS
ncbi:MAG: hypothetical protein QNK04_32425 [Myxococcota bacterium]|nr:hypothetical protein [Myxococcota bacterium]